MKRILLLLFIISSGLFLAGCDLVSNIDQEQIDDIVEDVCVENPDLEQCQDILDGEISVEESVSAVNELINAYLDPEMDSQMVCETYFDGIDDDCNLNRDEELLGDFGLVLNALDSDDDGDGIYTAEFEVTDGMESETVTLEIKITKDADGNVTAVIVETVTEEPISEPYLDKDEALLFFEEFIEDYLNKEIPLEDLANTYFDGLMPEGLSESRVIDHAENTAIAVSTVGDLDQDGFLDIVLAFTTNDITTYEEIEIRVNRIEMALHLEFGDDDSDGDSVPYDEAKDFIVMYISDYNNQEVSSEYMFDTYFGGAVYVEFNEQRDMDHLMGVTYNFVELYEMEDSFALEFEKQMGDTKSLEKVEIRVNRIEMALVLLFDGEDNDCDAEIDCQPDVSYEEAKELLLMYIDDYNNPDISTEQLSQMYFYNEVDMEFLEQRKIDLESGVYYQFLELYVLDEMYGSFLLDYERVEGSMISVNEVEVKVNRIDMALVISFDNGLDNDCDGIDDDCDGYIDDYCVGMTSCEYLPIDGVQTTLTSFISDYMNKDVTTQYIRDMYFGGSIDEDFSYNREADLLDDVVFELISVEAFSGDPLAPFVAHIRITFDTTSIIDEKVFVRAIQIRDASLMQTILLFDSKDDDCNGIDDDCDGVIEYPNDIEMLFFLLDEFSYMINDSTIGDICFYIVNETSTKLCNNIQLFHSENQYYFELQEVFEVDGMYYATFSTNNAAGEVIEINEFLVKLDETATQNPLHIETTNKTVNPMYVED